MDNGRYRELFEPPVKVTTCDSCGEDIFEGEKMLHFNLHFNAYPIPVNICSMCLSRHTTWAESDHNYE